MWIAPIDGLQQIDELRQRDRHDADGRRRPDEPAPFQALGVERQTKPVVPEHLDQVTNTDITPLSGNARIPVAFASRSAASRSPESSAG